MTPQVKKPVLSEAPSGVRCLSVSPDGKTIATGDVFGLVRAWDAETLRSIAEFKGHVGQVYAVDFSPDGKTLASGGLDPHVLLWDLSSKRVRAKLEHRVAVRDLEYSRDGRWLVTGGEISEPIARVWDARTLLLARKFTIQDDSGIDRLAISPDGKTLAIPGDERGSVALWNLESGKKVATYRGGVDVPVGTIRFTPDGTRLLALIDNRAVKVWDLKGPGEREFAVGFAMDMVVSPDGKLLVTGGAVAPPIGQPGHFSVWSLTDDRRLAERTIDGHPIYCMQIFGKNMKLVTGSAFGDTGLKIWSLEDLISKGGN